MSTKGSPVKNYIHLEATTSAPNRAGLPAVGGELHVFHDDQGPLLSDCDPLSIGGRTGLHTGNGPVVDARVHLRNSDVKGTFGGRNLCEVIAGRVHEMLLNVSKSPFPTYKHHPPGQQ